MSPKPEGVTCRLSIEYIQSGRRPLGKHLPEQLVATGRAWAEHELVSGRKVHVLDQQRVVETYLFTTYPNLNIDIDWKITTSDRVYTVHNVERLTDHIIITGEADARHNQANIKGNT